MSNPTMQSPVTPPWWLLPPLLSSAETGLTSEQASARLRQVGPNRFIEKHESPLWLQYLAHFKNPLVLILLLASTLSALLGELMNFIIISVIVMASVTLDFLQEHRAHHAAEKLRQSMALHTRVLRNGVAQQLPIAQIVPGDIVLLKAGDMVPADGLVIDARDCFVNQSLLTGESYPVEKSPSVPTGGEVIQAATNAVFMGSSIVSGSARICIMRTGSSTDMGAIAERISGPEELTSFDIGTRRFNGLILRLTTLMVLFVLLVNLLSHKPWLESFLFAVALAVGLTPELLPMVISVTLARGSVRMAREHVIVKRQSAIQDLGSMDVLCTDKTGTLTEATIGVAAHVDPLGVDDGRVLQLAYLNSWFESGLHNPMDEAILAQKDIDTNRWTKIDEVPFDFERRRVSVLLQKDSQRSLIVKGAPEEIIRLCTQYATGDAILDIDADALERIRSTYRSLEDQGLRVLAIAHKSVTANHPHAVVGDEAVLVIAGFVAFLDPPKTSAGDALRALSKLGVQIKVLTGDSERVTRHIYQSLDLPIEGIVLGSDIEKLDHLALQAKVKRANLFCRLNPSQKERVIAALKASGHVVGYLGDGVNDAPSLHAADVGLSVDSAVDIAKAAADMILLKHDLNVLHLAVLEGRRTFGNIMKYIMMGTSSNFGNMFSMAGASVFLPFLPMKPVQILLNNILYDLSEIPIPLDEVDANELKRPHVLDIRMIRNFMWTVGPVSSVFDFLTFGLLLWLFEANEALFQTGWFIESMCTQVLVIFIIRTRGNPLKSRPNPLLAVTSVLVVMIAMALPFTELGAYFGFVPPPFSFFGVLTLLVISYLLVVEFIKRRFYRHHRARSRVNVHRH